MDIETSEAGRIKDRPGENEAIGRDDSDIEVERVKSRLFCGIAQSRGSPHGQTEYIGARMDGSGPGLLATTGWAGGLRVYGDDLMPRTNEGIKGGNGEFGTAHEGNPQRGRVRRHARVGREAPVFAAARSFLRFFIRPVIIWRFIGPR